MFFKPDCFAGVIVSFRKLVIVIIYMTVKHLSKCQCMICIQTAFIVCRHLLTASAAPFSQVLVVHILIFFVIVIPYLLHFSVGAGICIKQVVLRIGKFFFYFSEVHVDAWLPVRLRIQLNCHSDLLSALILAESDTGRLPHCHARKGISVNHPVEGRILSVECIQRNHSDQKGQRNTRDQAEDPRGRGLRKIAEYDDRQGKKSPRYQHDRHGVLIVVPSSKGAVDQIQKDCLHTQNDDPHNKLTGK